MDEEFKINAISLLVERDSEEYDRTLPGMWFHNEWLPDPEYRTKSIKYNRSKRKQGKIALEMLGISGVLPSAKTYNLDMIRLSLRGYENQSWWDEVWRAWREAEAVVNGIN